MAWHKQGLLAICRSKIVSEIAMKHDNNKGPARTISVPEAGQRYLGLSRGGAYPRRRCGLGVRRHYSSPLWDRW
jgi:hypothetical protein